MPATYEPIATTTLSSAASTITFSSIPSTYTDLRLVLVSQGSTTAGTGRLRFNNISTTTYSTTRLSGNGTAAQSDRYSNRAAIDFALGTLVTSSNWGITTFNIFSYTGSTNKTVLMTDSNDKNGSGNVECSVGLWRDTGAITRIDLIENGANFATGTTATLYGIKAA